MPTVKEIEKQFRSSDRKLDAILNPFETQLEDVERNLITKMASLLSKSERTDLETGALIDASLARTQVQDLMRQSGVFQLRDDVLSTGMQQTVNASFEMYEDLYDTAFQFSDLSLQELDQLKNLNFAEFNGLVSNASDELSRVVINQQFGALSTQQAIESMRDVVSSKMVRHVGTWVNTSIGNYHNKVNIAFAEDNNLNKLRYVGPVDSKTRPFGVRYIGKTMTREQWDALANNPSVRSIRGKQPLPISIWLTGWNKRGRLIGIKE